MDYFNQECSFEHGNEPLDSITFFELLEQLDDWGLRKKG
jgi:hypothetical protein